MLSENLDVCVSQRAAQNRSDADFLIFAQELGPSPQHEDSRLAVEHRLHIEVCAAAWREGQTAGQHFPGPLPMTQPTLYLTALIIAAVLSWWPGNWLVWAIWKVCMKIEKVPQDAPSPLVKSVGGLERVLYVMGVMSHHYEIIAGWLILKAFFGFMGREGGGQVGGRKQ